MQNLKRFVFCFSRTRLVYILNFSCFYVNSVQNQSKIEFLDGFVVGQHLKLGIEITFLLYYESLVYK